MDINKSSHTEKQYTDRIKFKDIDSDKDAVYRRICHRIEHEDLVVIGISKKWKYISIAASIALILMTSMFLYTLPEPEKLSYVEVTAMPGSKTMLVLPDSSTVWLNSNSTIRYPQKFTQDNRTVSLTGEGFFEVKKDSEKPFIVSLNDLSIKVLGTTFNVMTNHKDQELIEMTLLEGSIAIYTAKVPNTNLTLKPNQQAIYNKRSGLMEIHDVKASFYSSWVTGEFIFLNNTLEEIMTVLSRAFNTKIHLEGKALRSKKMKATFTHKETLDEILSVLQISARYTYKKEKGEIYIK